MIGVRMHIFKKRRLTRRRFIKICLQTFAETASLSLFSSNILDSTDTYGSGAYGQEAYSASSLKTYIPKVIKERN